MITEVAPLRASSSQVRAYISSLSASQNGAVSIQGDRGVMVLSYEKELTQLAETLARFRSAALVICGSGSFQSCCFLQCAVAP